MSAAVLLLVLGGWLVLQATGGQLPARLLSYRAPSPGEPPAGAAASGGSVAGQVATIAGGTHVGQLDAVTVARVAMDAGLTPDQAVTAVAIAKRESSFNTLAHNAVYPDDSYGLWQINRLAWPQFTPAELQTAEGNARAMVIVSSHGTNWHPWTTYSGSYLTALDMSAAKAAVDAALTLQTAGAR